jgi:crotonobetainyl-CoA:carnitine CoA-transferase CaiB-like acyl-CoA transferase
MMGVLSGVRVVEIAGIGPAPFCGMLLADMGADVILVERSNMKAGDPLDLGDKAIVHRGKRSLALDLKEPRAIAALLQLIAGADALLEGMRPGVMERLGLGPAVCLERNPRLVYGRMTGWGQDGPLAQAAGHDLNYIALSGALWYSGEPGTPPLAPPTLVGDLGGGALYLAMGVLAGILGARSSGHGQVVDAAIVDGSANMMNLLLSLHGAGRMPMARGRGLLDGPHWYGSYACADGDWISIGALEPQFYALLLDKLGLTDEPDFQRPYDPRTWAALRQRLAHIFAGQPRQHWVDLMEGSDACFAPVLDPRSSMAHPHMAARGIYSEPAGVLQAAPAPRFSSGTVEPGPVPRRGEHGVDILREAGLSASEIGDLLGTG